MRQPFSFIIVYVYKYLFEIIPKKYSYLYSIYIIFLKLFKLLIYFFDWKKKELNLIKLNNNLNNLNNLFLIYIYDCQIRILMKKLIRPYIPKILKVFFLTIKY